MTESMAVVQVHGSPLHDDRTQSHQPAQSSPSSSNAHGMSESEVGQITNTAARGLRLAREVIPLS